jgi:hypothetical protein
MANSNILFHLSRGNHSNNPVGMNIDGIPYGQSLGGQIFRSETIENYKIIYHDLKNEAEELFDPIVPSDFIKNDLNYRCVYITNVSAEPFILEEVRVSDVNKEPTFPVALTDINIAVEGVYTLDEVSRNIPGDALRPGNPSIYLDDEYDSTSKLSQFQWLEFKKVLSANDLPAEIPNQSVLKIWVRRTLTVDKLDMPDEEGIENFILSVKEFDSNDETSVQINYRKQRGRISLSNWFDYTITPGMNTSFIMHELLPKSVDISTYNIFNVFSVNKKVIIFYSQQAPFSQTKYYYCLVICPSNISENNKYVQIQMNFDDGLDTYEKYVSKEMIAIKKAFYDENKFYMFWKEEVSINDPCSLYYFGSYARYDRIAVDKLSTYLWTDSIFVNINTGWDNRRIETHDFLERRVIRKQSQMVNIQQFDDLFVLFTKNTTNKELLELSDINFNRNELLYIFEKDIDKPETYSSFNNFVGNGAEVFSQRLIPNSIPQLMQITSFNNAKNVYTNAVISNSKSLNTDVLSPRTIKTLLNGSRYVDKNSFHGREFKIGKEYVTYEFPPITDNINTIIVTSGLKIKNDVSIYSEIKDVYSTANILDNIVDGEIVPLTWFQQNVVDIASAGTKSIPLEWQDRVYRDEWITIAATLPGTTTQPVPFTLQYNFARNIWKTLHLDESQQIIETIHNNLTGQSQDSSAGKTYNEITREDFDYVLEPDTYQPLSIEINVRSVYSEQFRKNKFIIRYVVYFKGNINPILTVTAFATEVKNISYIFFNANKSFDMSLNYLDVVTGNIVPKLYYIQNIHNNF